MLPLLNLIKFESNSFTQCSQSIFIDIHQMYMRNVLLFGFVLSIARQIFGDTMVCHYSPRISLPRDWFNIYCFINGTFTPASTDNSQPIYHNYYQWIPVVLLLLAFSFHLPFRVWIKMHGAFLKQLTSCKSKEDFVKMCYIVNQTNGNNLFWKTWALELFYSMYLFSHINLVNYFLNQIFSIHGWSYLTILKIFPDFGVCYLNVFLTAGDTIQKINCLLPLCSIYRKIFMVLYMLVILLIIIHCINLIYRILFILYLRRKSLNKYYCLKIAKQTAESFEAQELIDEYLKRYQCKDYRNVLSTYLTQKKNIL